MKHVICYEGKVGVALGLMQEAYVPIFLPWINWRIGIEGTLQRPPYSFAQGIDWIRGFDKTKGTSEVFAVLQRVPSKKKLAFRYVGHMGIHNVQWPHGFATTGSIIGSTVVQGKGLGTEAKLLLLYHAFMILGVQKIISNVKAFNAQSAGHLLKCGYKPVGRYRRHHFHEGQRIDEILFEVFREDWEPIWQAYQASGTLPRLSEEQRSFIKTEMTA